MIMNVVIACMQAGAHATVQQHCRFVMTHAKVQQHCTVEAVTHRAHGRIRINFLIVHREVPRVG